MGNGGLEVITQSDQLTGVSHTVADIYYVTEDTTHPDILMTTWTVCRDSTGTHICTSDEYTSDRV